jgi:hypothetical protein
MSYKNKNKLKYNRTIKITWVINYRNVRVKSVFLYYINT